MMKKFSRSETTLTKKFKTEKKFLKTHLCLVIKEQFLNSAIADTFSVYEQSFHNFDSSFCTARQPLLQVFFGAHDLSKNLVRTSLLKGSHAMLTGNS